MMLGIVFFLFYVTVSGCDADDNGNGQNNNYII